MPTCTHDPDFLDDFIPEPDAIRQRIEQLETQTSLLRRLLTISLRRNREAERLAHHQRGANCGA